MAGIGRKALTTPTQYRQPWISTAYSTPVSHGLDTGAIGTDPTQGQPMYDSPESQTNNWAVAMLSSTTRFLAVVIAASMALCASAGTTDSKSIEQAAHGAYVTAINSNDVDTLLADLTDDIVYQSPGEPEIVGKTAVRKWLAEYFGATRTQWQKTSIGFVVNGEWAFERYTYKSNDTDKKTGAVTTDTGKGINIFRRSSDGRWRVAIDGWSSDRPDTR
jgi:ketosteroid isomerase-like protein